MTCLSAALKFCSLTLVTLAATASALAAAPGGGGYRIHSYLGLGDDSRMILIEGGYKDGVVTGEVFRVIRPAGSSLAGRDAGVPVETGAAKALMVYDHKTVAEITEQSTPISRQFYPKFAEVMAGDLAVPQRLEIRPNQMMAPEVVLVYQELFDNPNAAPTSFELSSQGQQNLTKSIEEVGHIRAGTLMVIGHTDSRGSSENNQIESYQRAIVVRQYMIEQLGFDPKRIVAIGKGEDELPEETLTPGFAQRARRIVLKVVPTTTEQ